MKTYTPRRYEAIIRDLLTTLTGGTVRESLTVPAGAEPILLSQRPVRRVSHLEGVISVGAGTETRNIPYRFTAADFELIVTDSSTEPDAIQFRETGRRPPAGSTLVVNYYPVQTNPVPLTDLNVGSVVRTLMETFARELTLAELNLEHIYRSAFLETAEGSALDRVVALVGIQRLPTGYPMAKMVFSRQSGTPGRITVPAGTTVTDSAGDRYATLTALTLEPGESTRETLAAGETPGTPPVEANTLNRLEVLIAGISTVNNPQPAYRLSTPETDIELRRRARQALQVAVRGTSDALKFGLLSIEGVKDVAIAESDQDSSLLPGELRLQIAYSDDSPAVQAQVEQRIRALKPAGVRVIVGQAARRSIEVRLELILAGSRLPAAELASLQADLKARLVDYLSSLPPGGKVRRAKLLSLALQDSRIIDVKAVLIPAGGAETEELSLAQGEILEVDSSRIQILPPTFEDATGTIPATTSIVSAVLPIHLVPGVTAAEASTAIQTALTSHLRSRRSDSPLSLDSVAAAIRDDSRFALVRAAASLTVETSDSRFQQLTDGLGTYTPAANETLQAGEIQVDVQEGGV